MSVADAHAALAATLGQALLVSGHRVVTAESCTGGLVAAAITAIAGSSDWFERGFVTYSNEAKCELLGVPRALIDTHGAVSEPVARAMAEGALAHSDADCALSVTGIAGPGGGTPTKPVGTVCFGWCVPGSSALALTHSLPGDRGAVRARSVEIALRGMIDLLRRARQDGATPD
jgi:nicotinamide-nucleotide amidase